MRALFSVCLVVAVIENTSALDQAPHAGGFQATGEVRACLSRRHIAEIRIVDDRNLLFRTRLRTFYLNRLPRACTALSPTASLRVESRTAALCDIDTVTIVSSSHGANGPACALGRFERVTFDAPIAAAGHADVGAQGMR